MKELHITIEGNVYPFESGVCVREVLRTACPHRKHEPLAAFEKGKIRALSDRITEDCELRAVDYTDEEGRRIYERSLRFLFLLAVRQVLGNVRVRMEHSAGYGLYIDMDTEVSGEVVARLEECMRELAEKDLPFEKQRWTREQAIEYFSRQGQKDKVSLLNYRPFPYFDMYVCEGLCEYFYGAMLPSTGYIRAFALKPHPPGLVMCMPHPENPEKAAPLAQRPKLMRIFAESARWHDILDCRNVADLNEMIDQGNIREFVRVCDALQEKKVAQIADKICEKGARAVLIAGPSSSGKTTFTHRLEVQLRVNGLRPVLLSLDHYYLPHSQIPPDDTGKPDLECLEALDLPLFSKQLMDLFEGKEVEIPRYSFVDKKRRTKGQPMRIEKDQPVLIEGIHGLNPRLCQGIPRGMTYRIYISALTTLNLDDHNRIRTTDMRLLRRLVRDFQFRGTDFSQTLDMWPSVRRGEEKYIFPYQEEADSMFNSSLAYEAAVLKKYAYARLAMIPEDSPHYTLSQRLVKFLNYVHSAHIESELAPTAILREFIGGCSFYL